ncbi:ParB N-terminal domain-containing protein [uncultured Roseobacter sp.]|uniref:ParB/RepB/Spo0J family partition protein n=1 Tax=uncultured Roseobacter sp. TaxID=114847 RepID=UPI00260698E1|nr:ParB N-terminal domain-containing protein [uncultured Roseobacter sp.]
MAKRKRLAPAAIADQDTGGDALETKAFLGWAGTRRPPIADISGDAAAQSALEEVSGELHRARTEGRMITSLPLNEIDDAHLVRDRSHVDAEEMQVLIDSLRSRGQQTAIEVVALAGGHYGLISGWRRLMALRQLLEQTQEPRFATVKALIRSPQSAPDAYRAMVEENEIRADLSFYERARIAVQAAAQGVYPDPQTAVQALFEAARPPKRSKILSFTTLVSALDAHLKFPAAIPEKLGLPLAAALQADKGFRRRLTEALRRAAPETATAERAVLERILRGEDQPRRAKSSPAEQIAPGVQIRVASGRVSLSGKAVDDMLVEDLRQWLLARKKKGND